MASYACARCKHAFVSDEARCPKCLRKSTVSEDRGPLGETAALAASHSDPDAGRGLFLALLGLSFVISLALVLAFLSLRGTLAVLQGEVPAIVGLVLGSFVSLGIAPRAAVASDRPMVTYAAWLGLSAAVGTSAMLAGIVAALMLADVSIVLAVVVAVASWLAFAIPAFQYAQRVAGAKERGAAPRRTGKWR